MVAQERRGEVLALAFSPDRRLPASVGRDGKLLRYTTHQPGPGEGPTPMRTAFDHVPGLLLYPDYFDAAARSRLVRGSLEVYERLEALLDPEKLKAVQIPQPTFVRSAKHNLPSEEHYARLPLVEADGRTIRCEYFPRYGEDGHALCYFQGGNLPDFVRDGLVERIRRTVEEEGLATSGQALTWKLTMNFYRSVGGTVAGFPFHVDIPSNGVVTMILNVHQEALFQIKKGDAVTDVELPVGGLLILSGESRYDWMHRVLPREARQAYAPAGVERLSLVLGFQ